MVRQKLGQHFLTDARWRDEIAQAAGIPRPFVKSSASLTENRCWIEIGAGHGEMTEYLAATRLPVYAIELDRTLIPGLERLAQKFSNLKILHEDVLEADVEEISVGRRVSIYGNLPYYITSPILHRLFRFAGLIDTLSIVIQAEVAQRLTAQPGTSAYGYLSVAAQLYSVPSFIFEIPAGAFSPPPEVSSALVILNFSAAQRRESLGLEGDENDFLEFVKVCFAQKRKTLVNNLRSLAEPVVVRQALESQSLRTDARAEKLTIGNFATLYERLGRNRTAAPR